MTAPSSKDSMCWPPVHSVQIALEGLAGGQRMKMSRERAGFAHWMEPREGGLAVPPVKRGVRGGSRWLTETVICKDLFPSPLSGVAS